MGEKRRDKREQCELRCVLSFEDGNFMGEVKDISLSGVLLRPNTHVGNIHVGDMCRVSLGGELDQILVCEVVRFDGAKIAVKVI